MRSGRPSHFMARYCAEQNKPEVRRSEDLRKGDLKKETERLIIAPQDKALRTNAIKASIEKQNFYPLCRMCGETEETINHLIRECGQRR